MTDIIYEDNHVLVVKKPANMPVQADSSQDLDLLTYLKKYIKIKYNKPGNVYLGLVHRLDRPVSGIMVFAKTSKAANRLTEQMKKQHIKKVYCAVVEGKLEEKSGTLIDYLLKDPKTNMTQIDKNGKEAILDYEVIAYKDNLSFVKITLKTGRSHQIRVQFASRNHPLYGDQKYNPKNNKAQIALFASELEFIHPITKEKLTFKLDIPNIFPYNIFK